jgi:cycloartenol synthase
VYDPQAGTAAERKAVEAARVAFEGQQSSGDAHHSSDLLLRLQAQRDSRRAGTPQAKAPKLPASVVEGSERVPGDTLTGALSAGLGFYSTLQAPDGHWPGDYGGPMFLMPGLLIALHVTGAMDAVLSREHKAELVRYLCNHSNEDGGYGLHIEGQSTMFGTVLSYISLRLLGVPAGQATAKAARAWILGHGGATAVPSWGKFWLAVLGVYEWHGLNPMPPEMWLLPYALPVHPGRMWCHCRMVYLPMCYVYGIRGTGPSSPLTEALRGELYCESGYGSINWDAARSACAKEDLYYPHPLIQDAIWWTLSRAEPLLLGSRLRKCVVLCGGGRPAMSHPLLSTAGLRCAR